MDLEALSTQEFLNECTRRIVEGEEAPSVLDTLKRISSGRMTERQFAEAQRKGFAIIYPQAIEAFKKGYYFGCQGLDFLSCLMLSEEQVHRDQQRWSQLLGAAQALGEEGVPPFPEIKEFAESRVLPKYEDRRVYINGDKSLKKAGELTAALRQGYIRRREAFLTAALKWGWKQVAVGAAKGRSTDMEA